MTPTYDYIIVGAGSAGCALAYRLSREASHRVLLLEAGGPDRHPMIHLPLGFAFLMKHPTLNWCYRTDPEPQLDHRQLDWPRGKTLGGSSSINGMIYIRGQREDYDHWAEQGCSGWSYDEVLPYFKRSEHNVNGANAFHGTGGPLWVDKPTNRFELGELFIQAAHECNIPYNDDFNGAQQEGAGYYAVNIRRGLRQSSARTFLRAAQHRPNLEIVTHAQAERVLIEQGRAVGVVYEHKGQQIEARLNPQISSEVILCGGTINTPQLLELSGIGDRDRITRLGLESHAHLPGVGENLQDHLTVNVQQSLTGVNTFYQETRPLGLLKNVFKMALQRRGLLTHPASEVGAFFRTSPDVERADAQIHFAPAAGEYNDKGVMVTVPGTTATVCYLRPKSRGSVHCITRNPRHTPSIQANYLQHPEDRERILLAVRRVREIFDAPAFDRHRGHELQPGRQADSDEALLARIRQIAESVYHPVGTCKMGSQEDPASVVDPQLQVHGIDALRVADCSVMPTLLSGNTHAAAVMIAERCADFILKARYPQLIKTMTVS